MCAGFGSLGLAGKKTVGPRNAALELLLRIEQGKSSVLSSPVKEAGSAPKCAAMMRLAFLLFFVTGAAALDNGLCKKPGLGWNSVRCSAQFSALIFFVAALRAPL